MAARVLIVGGEARAHALGWKISQSAEVDKIYFAPGNGGTDSIGENIDIGVDEHEKLSDFAKKNEIDLTVVSPEPPLASGLADLFRKNGLLIFGPSAKAAEIEASKAFATEFMVRHKIPHPESFIANSLQEAKDYISKRSYKDYVIKSSGLASGKGVIVPGSDDEAKTALLDIMEHKIFGEAGEQVVFQERLTGQEVSAFALSDGKNFVMLPFTQDHKQIFDGDKGPNTGGMGSYAPVPFVDAKLAEKIKKEIMQPAITGLAEEGRPFVGCLFAGLFITETGEPKVIEFNCRFGDPECQSLMMLIEEDFYPILLACAKGELKQSSIKTKSGAAATVCLASPGYPGDYKKGMEVKGLDTKADNMMLFHAGTKNEDGKSVASGGRVLSVSAYGKDLKTALKNCYDHIGENGAHFDGMHYRKDIGFRVLLTSS
jgi:phosphoribosylamine--glycine ligase